MASAPAARRLLAELISFPTVAGTPNGELVRFAAERLEAAGAAVTISTGARPDAHNLHAVLGPVDEPGLVLSGHTDVVAVDGQAWTRDPFVLHEHGARLYGRGTADMKGFIAAVLATVGRVRVRELRRPVHVVLSSDEELGCRGIRPLLPDLRDAIVTPWLTIVGEPTRLRVVDRHKGKLALRIEVRGRACHSARAPDGVNAVEVAARLIVGLRELAADLRDAGGDERFAVPYTTVSTGPIHGGVALNIVPDACTFEVELRHLPTVDPDALAARVGDLAAALVREMHAVDPGTGITLTRTAEYPGLAPGDSAAGDELAALAGTSAGAAVDFGTEAGLLQGAIGGTVLVCGPGDMAQGHRPDEYVEVSELRGAVALLERVLATLA